MNTDPAIAPGYRKYPPSNGHVLTPPAVVHLPRERSHPSAQTPTWPNLPARCFGADRPLPEWLLEPWNLLQSAAQRRRPLAARLADLTEVAGALDELFAI